jgi:hypothetical protein
MSQIKGDILDRYRAHLFEGTRLRKKESLMLEKYRKAHSLLCSGNSNVQTVKVIIREFGVSESQAYKIVRDSLKLYGDVAEADKKGLQHVMYENFMRLAKLARTQKDYMAMNRAYENAAKIKRLMDPDVMVINPREFLTPVPISFTTDPQALKEQQKIGSHEAEQEYVDFEEVDDEESSAA